MTSDPHFFLRARARVSTAIFGDIQKIRIYIKSGSGFAGYKQNTQANIQIAYKAYTPAKPPESLYIRAWRWVDSRRIGPDVPATQVTVQ